MRKRVAGVVCSGNGDLWLECGCVSVVVRLAAMLLQSLTENSFGGAILRMCSDEAARLIADDVLIARVHYDGGDGFACGRHP